MSEQTKLDDLNGKSAADEISFDWEAKADFHSEWTTQGKHRVLVSVREGFPADYEHEIAIFAARLLDNGTKAFERARVVQVCHDDSKGLICVHIGTDELEHVAKIESSFKQLVDLFWPGDMIVAVVTSVVERSSEARAGNHTAYIAEQLSEGGNQK